MTLEETFSMKTTENGDLSFNKVSNNNLLNILFTTEYLQNHLDEVIIGTSEKDKLFSMFIRDPRFGLGRRDLGRKLMQLSNVSFDNVVKAGRFDDLMFVGNLEEAANYFFQKIAEGNELAKKWAPRYSSKNLRYAREFAQFFGMNKQQYGHFIKCNTTEQHLSRKQTEKIEFEHVPSLALLKYYKRFSRGEDTAKRFAEYLQDVKSGKKEMHVSTTTVYDIFKNRDKIDTDLFFDKIEKISINCIPIVDTSGSMWDGNDSIGKALSIGHYLAKCSTYAPNKVITFSSQPQLITLGNNSIKTIKRSWCTEVEFKGGTDSQYIKEINSMITGDYSNTDFGAVMNLLQNLTDLPQYLVVLSDMEFDSGSHQSKVELQRLWKERGYTTKIVWWNLNSRNITAPEMDNMGNIFLSGYNPMLLSYLKAGFDGNKFLDVLIEEYKKNVMSV